MEWVEKAVSAVEDSSSTGGGVSSNSNNSFLASKCYLYQGIGYTLQAQHSHRHSETRTLRTKAAELFAR